MSSFPVRSARLPRRGSLLAAVLCTAVLVPSLGSAGSVGSAGSGGSGGSAERTAQVIVRAEGGVAAARQAVSRAGGTVVRPLRLVGGVAATLERSQVRGLARSAGVLGVSPDARGHLSSVDPALGYDATGDFGSLYNMTRVAGAQAAWKAGYTGKGVDVALLDSGVSQLTGLTSGNVVNGPDLSFESQDPELAHRDTFGHGTHMASIIVGRDAIVNPAKYADAKRFVGVAPDARVVSIKIAAADGAVDVSQVIAGLDWVTQHAHDPGMNIRVVNLSFGTDSTQDYRLDPLAFAAEAAWHKGIVVVVAGGNDGTEHPTLSDPAMDPTVIAVGAEDPMGTVTTNDDTVPAFATRGTTTRHVDLVAPAVHVLGLRDPGSDIDLANPLGRVGTRFLRGSGTSQATAVVSGAAAILLQRYPKLTPDQVKKMLMTSATGFPGASSLYRGSGALDVGKALSAGPSTVAASQPFGTGTGSLEMARGSAHVAAGGTDLVGEQDIFGARWVGVTWAPQAWSGDAWTGGSWNGNAWTGSGWTDTSWLGTTWAGTTWLGTDWAGADWSSHSWTSHSWTSTGWTGGDWSSH
ncbi:MAG: serine protease AprX, partial [Actinomycetota bacterium]|nr:serine protease AprX [Actinomycetota bacterium]